MLLNFFVVFLLLFAIRQYGIRKSFPVFFSLYTIGCRFPIMGPLNLNFLLVLLYFVVGSNQIKNSNEKYPLGYSSLFCIGSIFISAFFSKVGGHWPSVIVDSVIMYGMPLLTFYFVRDRFDVIRIINSMLTVALLTFLFSLIDFLNGQSVWLSFLRVFFGPSYGWDMSDFVRFGSARIQSFYLHSVSYGYYCCTFFAFFLLFVYEYRKEINISRKKFYFVLVSLLLGCVYTGSRSAVVPLAFTLLFFYRTRILVPKYLIPILVVIPIVLYGAGDHLKLIFDSIINSNDNNVGSTSDMRFNQLDICIIFFLRSPLIGLGPNALFEYVSKIDSEILGGESIWFSLLVNQGILGCVSYVFLYMNCWRVFSSKRLHVFVFLFLQMLVHTLTSTPGFDSGFFMCLILIYKRLVDLNYKRIK